MERKPDFPKEEKTKQQPLCREEQSDIRKIHRNLRDAMTAEEVQEKSRAVCQSLLTADWYTDCDMIYGYYPLGNEVDCRAFIEQALGDGKRVALPKISPDTDCRMEFYEITSLLQVSEGTFHVMEPVDSCPMVPEKEAVVLEKKAVVPVSGENAMICSKPAAVLVPGVAFDKKGNRYGYGKGYYDRYFARYPKLKRIALAYENQMEEQLAVQETDIPMERIYTEHGIYFGNNG